MADTLLKLHVTPRGSRSEIIGWRNDTLCVKITAPPVEGAANAAVVKFVADSLGVRKSQVVLVSGERSREKTVKVTGLSDSDVRSRISARSP
jgi:uncharacterized protein